MKVTIEKPSGYMVITETVKGVVYKRKYFGYSQKEAEKKFKEYLKTKVT